MSDADDRDIGESAAELATAIRELKGQLTEELVNLRARVLAVEQRVAAMSRAEEARQVEEVSGGRKRAQRRGGGRPRARGRPDAGP